MLVLVVKAGAPEHGSPTAALLGLEPDTQEGQTEDQELCLCLHVFIMDTGPAMI